MKILMLTIHSEYNVKYNDKVLTDAATRHLPAPNRLPAFILQQILENIEAQAKELGVEILFEEIRKDSVGEIYVFELDDDLHWDKYSWEVAIVEEE